MGSTGVLVVFVHDLYIVPGFPAGTTLIPYSGNLRVETDGVSTTNVHLTNSYLVRMVYV